MKGTWHYTLRGGVYNGLEFDAIDEPQPVLIEWKCAPLCGGHATFDPGCPVIVLRTAESYRRVEMDLEARRVVYDVGASQPDLGAWERDLVGVSGEVPER